MIVRWSYRPETYPETTNTSIAVYSRHSANEAVPSDRVESRTIANNMEEGVSMVESLKRQYGNR